MSLSDLARRLNHAAGNGCVHLPPLLVLTDERRLPDPEAVLHLLAPGDGVVLRHYQVPGRDQLAARLAVRCRELDLRFLIAGDPHLARELSADGLHLPEAMAAGFNEDLDPHWLVTVAAHGAEGLAVAARLGAHGALLSPVFPTASHPGAPCLGVERFAALCASADLPVYALGGVTEKTGAALLGTGCCGIAAIGGLRTDRGRL